MKRHIRGYKEDIRFYHNIGSAGAPPKDSDNDVIHQRHRGDACGNRQGGPRRSKSRMRYMLSIKTPYAYKQRQHIHRASKSGFCYRELLAVTYLVLRKKSL